MHSKDLFMWWLIEQQEEKSQEEQRPVLYAPTPPQVPLKDPAASREETKEARRVIIIDL